MNDTPQGDGNLSFFSISYIASCPFIRMNDTPQGDGNFYCRSLIAFSRSSK